MFHGSDPSEPKLTACLSQPVGAQLRKDPGDDATLYSVPPEILHAPQVLF